MFAIKQYGQQYDDVTQKKLREYKVWLIENYKPKTVNLRLRALNCYLESIGKEKLKLPFVRVQQKSYLENVISEADYEYFKSCLKKDDEMFWYFVIRFLAATGARVSELIIKLEYVVGNSFEMKKYVPLQAAPNRRNVIIKILTDNRCLMYFVNSVSHPSDCFDIVSI